MFISEYEGYDLTKYNEFLIECSKKDYSGQGTHKHHILPKFMGGLNHSDNLIELSYQDHFDAHVLLAECFDKNCLEYYKNYYSATKLSRWIDLGDEFRKRLSELNSGKNNPMFGRKYTEEEKRIISERYKGSGNPMFGKKKSPESIEATASKKRGSKHSEKTKQQMKKSRKKFQETEYGKKLKLERLERFSKFSGRGNKSDEHYEKLKEIVSEINGTKCLIEDMLYNSISKVCKKYNLSKYFVRKRIESSDIVWKDWKYV